jgi:hypothetical protein
VNSTLFLFVIVLIQSMDVNDMILPTRKNPILDRQFDIIK